MLWERSHRELEVTARAHGLPFSRRVPKAMGREQLSHDLHDKHFARAVRTLESDEIESLQAIVAMGGTIDERVFTHHFGTIRQYRSWHKPTFGKTDGNPRHPWRYPASVAEKLFHLGMIHRNGYKQIEIVREVATHLPPLPEHLLPDLHDSGGAHQSHATMNLRDVLLRDLSALLGVVTRLESRAIHGRWLSVGDLRTINDALMIPDDLTDVRSELGAGRLRWLHYLAQVTGLLDLSAGQWFITPQAWDWLDAPAQLRWDMLWHAVEHDLLQRSPLWYQFRFPEVSQFDLLVLRHLVADCIGINDLVGSMPCHRPQTYTIKHILHMAQPYLLESHPADLALFIRHILAWSGMVTYKRGTVQGLAGDMSPTTDSHLLEPTWLDRTIPILLSDHPHPSALTRLLSFASSQPNSVGSMPCHPPRKNGDTPGFPPAQEQYGGHIIHLTPDTIRTASRQGVTFGAVLKILGDLTHQPIPERVVNLLADWFRQATQLTLKPLVVLESDCADQIKSIHRDWRLRDHMMKKLSPHHIAVVPDKADELMRRLHARDHPLTSHLPEPTQQPINETLNPHMVDYLLLAVRTYQQVSDRHHDVVPIPAALRHWLRVRSGNPDTIESRAEAIVKTMYTAVPLQVALPTGVQDYATIERLVRLAHADGATLTITYYSPYADETSIRTILIDEIYESNEWTYLDAFCFRDDDQRTFRLDRVQRAELTQKNPTRRVG